MFKTIFTLLSFCIFTNAFGQDKDEKINPFFLNLIAGYESFGSYTDVNTKLSLNGFSEIKTSNLAFGMEIGGIQNRNVLRFVFYGANLSKSRITTTTALQTFTLGLTYGYDLLPKSQKLFLYPLGGLRMHDVLLFTKRSSDGIKIDASKTNLELLFGFGTKYLLNTELKGIINNIGLDCTVSLPLFDSKWKKDGKDFIQGTYKSKSIFNFTLTFGRAFAPRSN